MANRTDPDARTVHGTNPQVLGLKSSKLSMEWVHALEM